MTSKTRLNVGNVFHFMVLSLLSAQAAPVTTVLIDSAARNGSFEVGSGNTSISQWVLGFGSDEAQRKESFASQGTWSLVLGDDGNNLGAACQTDHVVLGEDTFDLSFDWVPKSGWDAEDQVKWRLFTTRDDTISGVLTEIASGVVSGFANTAPYQQAVVPIVTPIPPECVGQQVWLQFVRGASGNNEFARVDRVALTVTSDPEKIYVPLAEDDLAVYYPMEGDLLDYSARMFPHDGAWLAGEAYADGAIDGQCIDLSGATASATLPHVLGDVFTLTAWVKTSATAAGGSQWTHGHGLIDGSRAGVHDDIGLSINGARLAFGVGNPETTVFSTRSINDGEWHHLAVQRFSPTGKMRLFVDGALEAEADGPPGHRDTTDRLRLGSLTDGAGIVNACIDDIRVFDTMIDAEGIARLYDKALDFDSDGDSDYEELVAGSSWHDEGDVVGPVTGVYLGDTDHFKLKVDRALASRTYRLRRSVDPDFRTWEELKPAVAPDYHGPIALIDESPSAEVAYYRAEISGRGKVREKRPNIVIIYGDDVGYGDVKVYNPDSKIDTPHIDRLASQGLRFTDGHCSASTCSPSRFSMITGRFAFRNGVGIIPPTGSLSIPEDMYTMPDMLKSVGYNTAVIGKWHLGLGNGGNAIQWNSEISPGPLDIGFDHCFMLPTTNDRVPCVYMQDRSIVNADYTEALDEASNPGGGVLSVAPLSRDGDGDVLDPIRVHNNSLSAVNVAGSTQYPRYSDTVAADRLYNSSNGHNQSFINGIGRIGFMSGGAEALWEDQTQAFVFLAKVREYLAAQDNETPFFLYFASQDIHVPRAPHAAFQGETGLGWRGDAMVQFDWSVGQIMQMLEENELVEDTLVILSSDNGPVYGDGYDDGAGNDESAQGHDASGPWRGGKYSIQEGGTRVPLIVRWPAKIAPGEVSAALMNQVDFMATFAELLDVDLPSGSASDSRNALPALLGVDPVGMDFTVEQNNTGSAKALRVGHLKYVGSTGSLYDLSTDPTEENNLAGDPAFTATVNEMAAQLSEIVNGTGVREE